MGFKKQRLRKQGNTRGGEAVSKGSSLLGVSAGAEEGTGFGRLPRGSIRCLKGIYKAL